MHVHYSCSFWGYWSTWMEKKLRDCHIQSDREEILPGNLWLEGYCAPNSVANHVLIGTNSRLNLAKLSNHGECDDFCSLIKSAKLPYIILRHYPKGLGIALVNIFKNLGPQADLRGKPDLPMQASDRELFEAEPLGDPWWDAELPDVFFYLLKNKRLNIPESWKPTIMAFKAELEAAPGFWNIQTFFYQNIGLNFSQKTMPKWRL